MKKSKQTKGPKMWWKSDCRRMRPLIALCVGNDLDEEERGKVRRHAATCPTCRDEWVRLQSGQQVLQSVVGRPVETEESPSVWPGVQRQIMSMPPRPAAAKWQRWAPAVALTAACLGILISSPVVQSLRNGIGLASNEPASESYYRPNFWRGQDQLVGSGLPQDRSGAEIPSVRTFPGLWNEGWQRGEPVRVKPFDSFPPLVPGPDDANEDFPE
jgi:hypothetical protein